MLRKARVILSGNTAVSLLTLARIVTRMIPLRFGPERIAGLEASADGIVPPPAGTGLCDLDPMIAL